MIMDFNKMSDHGIIETLGERLRQLRLEANLTRKQLATEAGLSSDTVRNAENGANVSLESLLRMLRVLGRLDELSGMLVNDGPSPVEMLESQGRVRQRARAGRDEKRETEWQW
jgi:transcriptional regulator with XRE-family HTH domain